MQRTAAILCLLILTACSKEMGGAEIAANVTCRQWPETSYSKLDTKQTRFGNQFNNKSRDAMCPGVPPPATPRVDAEGPTS